MCAEVGVVFVTSAVWALHLQPLTASAKTCKDRAITLPQNSLLPNGTKVCRVKVVVVVTPIEKDVTSL